MQVAVVVAALGSILLALVAQEAVVTVATMPLGQTAWLTEAVVVEALAEAILCV
jgi:hypothetical protein